jgi:hypothetical protein
MGTAFEGGKGVIHVNGGEFERFPAQASEALGELAVRREVSEHRHDNW